MLHVLLLLFVASVRAVGVGESCNFAACSSSDDTLCVPSYKDLTSVDAEWPVPDGSPSLCIPKCPARFTAPGVTSGKGFDTCLCELTSKSFVIGNLDMGRLSTDEEIFCASGL